MKFSITVKASFFYHKFKITDYNCLILSEWLKFSTERVLPYRFHLKNTME